MAAVNRNRLPPIVNSVLGFGHVRLKHMDPEEVCDSLLSTFEVWEFGRAKDKLWKSVQHEGSDGAEILGEKPNGNEPSCLTTRSAAKVDCQDLLKALRELDAAGALPDLAVSVDDLVQLPPIAPQLEISCHKRQVAWDTQVSRLEDEIHQSQDALKDTLASIQEAQERMAEEMTQVRHRLDAQALSVGSEPRSSTPDLKKPRTTLRYAPRPTFADVVREETGSSGSRDVQSALPMDTLPWTVAGRGRRKRKVVTGTQECKDSFRGAPEVRSLFVSNVSKDTLLEEVRKHIGDRCDGLISVRLWSHPDAPVQSFKVTVRKECVGSLVTSEFPWPRHVRVRRFVPRRGPPPAHVH